MYDLFPENSRSAAKLLSRRQIRIYEAGDGIETGCHLTPIPRGPGISGLQTSLLQSWDPEANMPLVSIGLV
jgi:hypothetical protein